MRLTVRLLVALGVAAAPALLPFAVLATAPENTGIPETDVSRDVGNITWNYQTGAFVETRPAVESGTVYIGSWDDSVYALNAADGTVEWSFNTSGDVQSSPVVTNGTVYVGTNNDSLYALDSRSRSLEWRFATGSDVEAGPTVGGGTVFSER